MSKRQFLPKISFAAIIIVVLVFAIPNFLKPSLPKFDPQAKNQVIGWGNNNQGQLGAVNYGQEENKIQPLGVAGGKALAAGQKSSIILNENGQMFVAGPDVSGLDDTGKMTFNSRAPRLMVAEENGNYQNLPKIKQIGGKRNTFAALDDQGNIWNWGDNFSHQQGGDLGKETTFTPHKNAKFNGVGNLAVGYRAVLGLKGENLFVEGAECPAEEVGKAIDAYEALKKAGGAINNLGGYFDPYSITDQGEYGTLQNDCLNQLYVGFSASIPVPMAALSKISKISMGYGQTMAISTEGKVFAFGCNLFGQVGVGYVGNKDENTQPQELTNLKNIVEISAGFRHSLALDKDGNVWAWGLNARGQLGDGTIENRGGGVKIDLTDVVKIFAGHDVSFAIKKDGSLWGWGENHNGIFLDNKEAEYTKPILISDKYKFIDVSASADHVIAIVEQFN